MKLKTKTPKFRCARLGISLATTALAAITLSAASAQDNTWTGGTSTDWNTAANWSGNAVPTGQNAVVNNASGNIATITADLAATPNDIVATGGGRIDHIAGTAGTGGGSWMFVGQDSTLSTYNLADTSVAGGGITGYGQGSGTLNATGNLQVAAWGGNRVGTMNINTTGALNVTGALRIGNDGGSVGIMNLESGTVVVSNNGAVFAGTENNIGHGGGIATLNISGGSLSVSNGLRLGNESGGNGTLTLSGTGALNVADELIVGRESGTGVLNVNGGTITTSGNGNMYIGRRNGTGTLNQSNGVISVIYEFGVGTRDDNKIGTGTYNLSGGTLSAGRNIFIGKEQGSSGTMDMTGGTMNTSDKLKIGHNQATGDLTQSGGTINVQNEVYIGNENSASSVGTYTLSGTGVLNVGNEVIVGRDNGTGTFNLDGGTVNATKISGGNGSATVNFNGGVLKAKRDESNLIENLDVANVQSGGAKISSNGFNVATSQALSGTGGLEKLGAGSLTLSANNTYAGTTTVSEGLLKVNGSVGSVTVSSGGSLGGSGTVGSLSLSSGSFLTPGNSPGTLTASSATISGGSTYNWQITSLTGSAGTNWDLLNVTGEMNLSDISSSNKWNLVITADGDFTGWTGGYYDYVFAQAASTSGFSAAAGTDVTDLFNITSSGITSFPETNVVDSFRVVVGSAGGLTNFTLKAVPEPSSVALTLLGLVSTLALARRRR